MPASELQAEVVLLVTLARTKVPSHRGLVSDEERGWAELALDCCF